MPTDTTNATYLLTCIGGMPAFFLTFFFYIYFYFFLLTSKV